MKRIGDMIMLVDAGKTDDNREQTGIWSYSSVGQSK